jgi:hypothetical protein
MAPLFSGDMGLINERVHDRQRSIAKTKGKEVELNLSWERMSRSKA